MFDIIGAGKSTFIEQLGIRYIEKGHSVAVIPVDPSSHISGGSILGDKTRMEVLSKSEKAYVRASPTRGVLGGIAEHTSDVIALCEFGKIHILSANSGLSALIITHVIHCTAGYDVVIVESVGLGQSEVDIDAAVDMLLLLVPPGGGDSLQASKKGIMEAADLVVVNKADGSLLEMAKHTKADYSGSMQFIRQKNPDWRSKVLMISARTGFQVNLVVEAVDSYFETMRRNRALWSKRTGQARHWMREHFRRLVLNEYEQSPLFAEHAERVNRSLESGAMPPRVAANNLFNAVSRRN